MRSRLGLLSAGFLLFLASCTASATEITALDEGATTSSTGSVAASENPQASSDLTNEAVYEAIENSIVFVMAPDGLSSGSGIVIDGGWILTNAHVVDRHATVNIGRSDGEDLGSHAVHAVDWIFDLALVGPVDDASLRPIAQGSSADLALGTRVLLAGFPDEDTLLPTPTLTEGIVSRERLVAIGNYPFVQVDATIAPGQSGGALVNARGELVGISGLEFGEGEFGLAFAADEMWPRIDNLIANATPNVPTGPAVTSLSDQVGPLRNFGFTVEVGESGSLDILVTSPDDVWVDIQTLGGITVSLVEESADPFRVSGADGQLYIDELAEGGEEIIANLEPGTYQVVIGSFGSEVTDLEISSGNELRRFVDVEEAQTLAVNEIVEGDFDWTRDTDRWELPLTAGQDVSIVVDGIADTLFVVRLDDVVVASSDDEGIGVFGTGSQADFVAEETGTYVVEIGTYDQTRWGYLVEVRVN